MEKVYNKAEKFILREGTDTQKVFFKYLTGDEKKENVVKALKKYQNEDGGWANGLEIEYQGNISSPMTTAAALGYIYLFGLEDAGIFHTTLNYLQGSQQDNGSWDDKEEIQQFNIPPYYAPGAFTTYKTGMILKWLRRLEVDDEMVSKGYAYLIDNYKLKEKNNDMWTAIGYINAFAEYPHQMTDEIISWASGILMGDNKTQGVDMQLPWERVQGMIYDDDKLLISLKDKVLESIKKNQQADGSWPHQFGTYNQVWAAVMIIRYLKMVDEI